jgi:hypothetical protein
MLKEWLRTPPGIVAFHATHIATCALALWGALRLIMPARHVQILNETTGEMEDVVDRVSPYTLTRCLIWSAAMLILSYLAIWPLSWPLVLGFPGFQLLYMLLGLAVWLLGCRLIAGGLLGQQKSFIVLMLYYMAVSALVNYVRAALTRHF